MSASNINPSLLNSEWSLDGKAWRLLLLVSARRSTKWQRFNGPIASMRYTSGLKIDGRKRNAILLKTTDQEHDEPEFALLMENVHKEKVSPASLRQAMGKKTGTHLARKTMHSSVHSCHRVSCVYRHSVQRLQEVVQGTRCGRR